MSREFELKLHLPARHAAAFRSERMLVSLARGPVVRRRLRGIYFDTEDRQLSKAGVALRVRRIGRQWLQTIKLPQGVASANVHEEIERRVDGAEPDLAPAELKLLARAAGGGIRDAALVAVFETRIERTVWPLRLIESDIELVYDRGRILAGDRVERISEIELELESGDVRRLFELAMSLLEHHPLHFEPQTKAARGFALADNCVPAPVRAAPVKLTPDMTVREALSATTEACLWLYHANGLVLRAGEDPEGIHQMRVALRRFRALVSACDAALQPDAVAFLARELRWLQQQLGPARDWDVFIAETLDPMLSRLPDDPDLPALRHAAVRRQKEAYKQARAAIDDPHHCAILLRIGGWLATGDWVMADGEAALVDFADERLHERYRKLRKFGRAVGLPLVELHRMRIVAKKLRYVAEFFRSIYPKKSSKPFFVALTDLQDDLGSINDAVVTEKLMDEIEPIVARRIGTIRAARARSLITGWQAQRIEHDLNRFLQVWDRFRKCRTFWRKPPKRSEDPSTDGIVADAGPTG
jgi:inorganic triphosphatase YgiF